jgi:carboxylate-amine ligase
VGRVSWATWNAEAARTPWTIGIEEEVMLLDPDAMTLASRSDAVLLALSPSLARHAAAETHGSALELATGVHATVADGVAELARLRALLAAELAPLGLAAAVAGTHPFARWEETQVSPGARYQSIFDSMRELARREPTFALHVHVALPGPEEAVRALSGLRAHLPVLLAVSANSPFWQGRLTGLASTRIPVFGAFPRVGIPRAFADYAEYVAAVDLLVRCDAFPEPTFLWWDVRLQPKLGTLEVRVMDAQTRVADVGPLVALTQCLVRLEALEGHADPRLVGAPEVLDENRFLAARDGVDAQLIDPVSERRRPVRDWLDELLEACAPHAAVLGCTAELAAIPALAASPGAARQVAIAGVGQGVLVGARLAGLVRALHASYDAPHPAALAGTQVD